MRAFSILLLLCSFICGIPSFVSATEQPVFLKAVPVPPLWSTDALEVALHPDEEACKKAYGKKWEELCTTYPGSSTDPVAGITISPEPEGKWYWSTAGNATFSQDKPWPASTSYTVNLSKVPLPARVRLSNKSVTVTTPPLSAAVALGTFWIDPDINGERIVSFALRFTSPPDTKTIEQTLKLVANDKNLTLAPPRTVWTENNTHCLVSARILTLSAQKTLVRLTLPNIRTLAQVDDVWQIQKGDAAQSLIVPGTDTLFTLTRANLERVKNTGLTDEYHLVLRTSLRVRPEDALKHLTVVELPVTQNAEAVSPFRWNAAPVISAEDINRGRVLRPELTTLPGESTDVLRFRIPVEPGRHVLCALPAGFGPGKERDGKQLGLTLPWQAAFRADTPEPFLSFLQPGNVLTLSGDRKLDIVSSGVTRIRWRAMRIMRDRMNAFADINAPFEWADNSLDADAESVEGSLELPQQKESLRPCFSTLDMTSLLKNAAGLVRLELTGYQDDKEIRTTRLLLMTDLGMVIKKTADGSRDIFICSLAAGTPVADAVVQIVALNGRPLVEARTDAKGHARLPSVRGLNREKEAVAVVATLEKGSSGQPDLTWISLKDATSTGNVDYSRFPIHGQYSAQNGVNAHVFPQRDLFRPGETMRFGIIVRRGDWQTLPPDMPFTATLRDPAGRIATQRPFTVGDGLNTLSWDAPENASTGAYRLEVSTPDPVSADDNSAQALVLGSARVGIEDFQPDTLFLTTEPRSLHKQEPLNDPVGKGWLLTPAPGTASVTGATDIGIVLRLQNLYGLPAAQHRVSASLFTKSPRLQFPGYSDYNFSALQSAKVEDRRIGLLEARTDAQGQAVVPLPSAVYQGGTMTCTAFVEGYEADGGRSVFAESTFILSPLTFMLGYRPTGALSNLQYIPQDAVATLDFIAINHNLDRVNPGPLTFAVAERRMITSLVTDAEGDYKYDETPLDTELSSTTETCTPDKPLSWKAPTNTPGEFLLSVKDAKGTVMARIPFTVAGNDDLHPALTASSTALPTSTLRLRLDKADYAPGDTVQLFLSAPYDGTGLVTLERDSVVVHEWINVMSGNSVHTLKIPADFEGRGFINVSVARALTSPEIFMQPHSYALAPITVNMDARDMGLRLTVPEKVLPGQSMTVTVNAKTPGRVVVFAVDEGVLQLTRFETPDPLKYLLLDRALEVQTSQLFDRLMPDHALLGKRLPAFGGGDDDMGRMGMQNPFKRKAEPPLSWWAEPVDVGTDGVTVTIPVPDYYNGQVRIMAVGISATTAGKADAQTFVRGPLVLTPQTPLFATPGDAFEAGFVVANTTDQPQSLRIALEADTVLQVRTSLPEILLAPGEDTILPLQITVGETLGNATLQCTVTDAQGQETRRATTLSVRPPTPFATELRSGRTTASTNLPAERQLYPYEAQTSVSVSATPLPALRGLLRYLDRYPYSCPEQDISRAFPHALLLKHPTLQEALRTSEPETAKKQAREAQDRALAVIRELRYSQPSTDMAMVNMAYAGDYLLALREGGLTLPGDLSTAFFDVLENVIDGEPQSLYMARAQAYGIWVLTREGRITTQQLERLTTWLDANATAWASDVTGTLVAGSYAIMRLDDKAASLLKHSSEALQHPDFLKNFSSHGQLNPLAAEALHVAVLARHFPDRLAEQADALSALLLESLNRPGGYATFSAAQGARALLALTGKPVDLQQVTLACSEMQPGFAPLDATPVLLEGLLTLNAPGCERFSLTLPEATPPLYWEVSTEGYDRKPPNKVLAQGMELSRRYIAPSGQTVAPGTPVQQGQVLLVELTVRVFGENASNSPVILVDLLPGGFEQVLFHPEERLPPYSGETNRREDRMILQLPNVSTTATYVYAIRAVTRGTFTLPPALGEGLYNRMLQARTPAGTITVH